MTKWSPLTQTQQYIHCVQGALRRGARASNVANFTSLAATFSELWWWSILHDWSIFRELTLYYKNVSKFL